MNKMRLVIGFLIMAILITACGGSAESIVGFDEGAAAEPGDFEREASFNVAEDAAFDTGSSTSDSSLQDIPQERLIIRTGDLSLVVEDTEEMMADIERMVDEAGGWVMSCR
ncbi:MAG: hypothetical protein ACE5FD_07870, partial [Anaerolineae bacterium]